MTIDNAVNVDTEERAYVTVERSEKVRKRVQSQSEPKKGLVWFLRGLIVVVVLLAWQYLPQIPWLRERWAVFDPFYVSSPTKVAERIWQLMTASAGQPSLWSYLWVTLQGAFLGLVIGLVLGSFSGLLVSNSLLARRVVTPFIAIMNAIPRVALIPFFVILAGPTLTSTTLTAVIIVYFLVFYNAYAGGISVSDEMIQNARLLGATRWDVMRRIRLPYVMVWTFTSLPNAISFSLLAVVTAEILTGTIGMGRLLGNSVALIDATLTWAVIVILAVVSVVAVSLADYLQRRILHWWYLY